MFAFIIANICSYVKFQFLLLSSCMHQIYQFINILRTPGSNGEHRMGNLLISRIGIMEPDALCTGRCCCFSAVRRIFHDDTVFRLQVQFFHSAQEGIGGRLGMFHFFTAGIALKVLANLQRIEYPANILSCGG